MLVVFFLGQNLFDVGLLLQIAAVVGQTTVDECSKKSLEMKQEVFEIGIVQSLGCFQTMQYV